MIARQIPRLDNEIDEPCHEQRIGLVRIFWRRDAGGLLDDPGPHETDLRARLGNEYVAERGKTCRNAAKCRVGQNGNEGKLMTVMHGNGRGNFRHLHQRKHAFLHARASAGGDAHDVEFGVA